jgi:hypothetical protein
MCAQIIDDIRETLTVGLDVGDTYTQVCVLDDGGEVVEESRLSTTPKAFRRRFAAMAPARLVLEAGNHSHWASRFLAELGHEVIVANPRMLRFIYGNDSKNETVSDGFCESSILARSLIAAGFVGCRHRTIQPPSLG